MRAIQCPAPPHTLTGRNQLAEERHVWEYVYRVVRMKARKRGGAWLDEDETASIVAQSIASKWDLWDPRRGHTKRASYLAEAAWRDYLKVISWWNAAGRETERVAVSLDRLHPWGLDGDYATYLDALASADDPAGEVLAEAAEWEEHHLLARLLTQITPAERRLIRERLWEGRKFREIAADRGVCHQAIWLQWKALMRRLRRLAAQAGVER